MPPFTRPTKLPEWASGDAAAVVEPTSGEKALGWLPAQSPPAQYFNWLMGGDFGYYPWLQYVSTFEQQALTWPERQTFSKGFAASGQRSTIAGLDVTSGLTANGISPAAGTGLADTPYNDVPLPAPRFLTSRHVINASPLRYARAYLTATGYEYAVNAWWDDANSQWVADDTVSPAILFRLTGSSIRVCRVATPSSPFNDAAFTEAIVADSTAGGRGKALGYAADGLATFTDAIRSAAVLAGSATFPWATPGVWSTSDAFAWSDATGCGNLSGSLTANNATIKNQVGPYTVAILPAALRPHSGSDIHGTGYYIPPSGISAAPVRVSINSAGEVNLFYIPDNALSGTAAILLPCLHWRLQSG